MKPWQRVAIVGVGLIGGSIGIDLLRRGLAVEVIGVGRRASSLRIAKRVKAVTHTTMSVETAAAASDLVIVCTPVDRIAEDVITAAGAARPGTYITDAGSTKGSIVAAVEAARKRGQFPADVCFVGSHPMAGGEKSGPGAATADLFKRRTVVVTPTESTRLSDQRVIYRLWRSLDAKVVTMTPAAHDAAVAAISHLPHIAAAALAGSTAHDDLGLAASGWRDTTRIASGDPLLWRAILLDNRAAILATLERYHQQVGDYLQALRQGDGARLETLLWEAKRSRDAVGS